MISCQLACPFNIALFQVLTIIHQFIITDISFRQLLVLKRRCNNKVKMIGNFLSSMTKVKAFNENGLVAGFQLAYLFNIPPFEVLTIINQLIITGISFKLILVLKLRCNNNVIIDNPFIQYDWTIVKAFIENGPGGNMPVSLPF